MSLVLYNTFTKKEEPFTTMRPKIVKMYTCGPTVYGRPHIGNYSSFLMADLLRRWLEVSGYEVQHVKNITDVGHLVADQDEGEDKIEKQARAEKADPLAIARKYTEQYLDDEKALNMLEPFARPRATETIPEMIAIMQALMESGHAYETEDGVYFSVMKFTAYGSLSGNTLDNLNAGARISVDEKKKHPADFALWKKTVGLNAHHILHWPSPWGEGFPGWHIECSAMARKLLGPQLDIHTGGEDNIFPHHECEIAQSESSGPAPFSRFWIHKRRIDLGEAKMSKSLGNVLTLPDLHVKNYSPLDLRYYLLSVHYRTNLKFTWKGMDDAKKARLKIIEWFEEVERDASEGAKKGIADDMAKKTIEFFFEVMNQDLNTPAALAEIFELMSYYRRYKPFAKSERKQYQEFIRIARQTFGCFEHDQGEEAVPKAVTELLQKREAARGRKDFVTSDQLRDEIQELGFDVKDTAHGQQLRRRG